MRNLKRALSLTLASVMLLGMMVVGAGAASYPDVDESNNIEAIEVLQAVKVMEGDNAGNFDPDRPVSRAEMAVIMALLLNLDYDYYRGTKTFNDVPSWCAPYVAACYANGITSGYNATTYGSADTVNAVQAASMMMRALGYFKFSSDYEGDFVLSTVKQASKIELFKGINANSMDPLTRNQVAQLALNALKTPIVEPDDNTITIKDANGNIIATGGQVNYVVTASSQAYARAIDDAESKGTALNGVQGYIIELGEKLYSGKLKLNDSARDVFGRPSRQWEYDGKPVGTYAKYELISQEYTKEVTGRELYDLLGADTITSINRGGINDYVLNVAIDGISDSKIDSNVFNVTAINRNNKAGVGATGNGVLTQVFVDGDKKVVDIAVINTYLAKADRDYDTKKENVTLEVYGLSRDTKKNLVKTITTGSDTVNMPVSSEDFVVENVKKGDTFLVTVADNDVQSMRTVSPMAAVEITSFKSRDLTSRGSGNLTTGGTKYDFSDTAEYENTTLVAYTDGTTINLKDTTYDVYLDAYGYVIGVVEVDKPTNYVFITGVNSGDNNLASVELTANAIFLDGTMKTIKINRKDSTGFVNRVDSLTALGNKAYNSTFNRWCTYNVDDDNVYTLTLVTENAGAGAEGQSWITNRSAVIDEKHISIDTVSTGGTVVTGGSAGLAYGNNDSVYISAEVERILTTTGRYDNIISDVNSVTTGIGNVDILPLTQAAAQTAAGGTGTTESYGVYTVYDKDGWVIAMVVIGEDNGSNSDLVYVHNASVSQEYFETQDGKRTYRWTRTVVIDGEEVELEEVNTTRISMLNEMDANNWYRVRRNTKNEVTAVLGSYQTGAANCANIDNDGTKPNANKNKIGNWGFTATSAPIAYNTDYNGSTTLVGSMNANGVDTVLYHEAFNTITQSLKPSADKQSVYVIQGIDSGLRYAPNVKVVLDQMNDNKRETYFGEGESDLKQFLKDLHQDASGNYNYEISAVIEGPSATSIVIRDRVEDGNSGNNGGPGFNRPNATAMPYNATIRDVNTALANNQDVVIVGNWLPSDLSATNYTVNNLYGAHLYIDGDLNASWQQNVSGIVINGSADSKLTVTGKLTTYSSNMDGYYGTMTVGGLEITGRTATLNGEMDIIGISGHELTVVGGATLIISEDMTIYGGTSSATTSGAGTVNVAAHVDVYGSWSFNKTNVTEYNTLNVVGGTIRGIITLGDGSNPANNGRIAGNLAANAVVVYKNVGVTETINVPANTILVVDKKATLGNVDAGAVLIVKDDITVTGTLATSDIVLAPSKTITLTASTNVSGDAASNSIVKDSTGSVVIGTAGTELTITNSSASDAVITSKKAGDANTGDTLGSGNQATVGSATTPAAGVVNALPNTEEKAPAASLPFTIVGLNTVAELKAAGLSDLVDGAEQQVDVVTDGKNISVNVAKSLNVQTASDTLKSMYNGVAPDYMPTQAILYKLTGVNKVYQYKADWTTDSGATKGVWVERSVPADGWVVISGDNVSPVKLALVATETQNTVDSQTDKKVYTVEDENIVNIVVNFKNATMTPADVSQAPQA